MSRSKTMHFEYNPERLIEEVKKRPGIWDNGHVSYRTMATRTELWNDVVRELLQPNLQINKSAMRELVIQLQKKWKSIKGSYMKYIHRPNKTKRPYIYSKQMSFMNKRNLGDTAVGQAANKMSSESEDASLKNKRKKVWNKKNKVISKTEVSDDDIEAVYLEVEPYSQGDDEDAEKSPKPNNAKALDEFAFANVSSVDSEKSPKPNNAKALDEFANVSSVDSAGGDDCDRMFLLSLLSHLKSIPEPMRLNAKMEFLMVLKYANTTDY